jgi:hypothetical protein
VLVSAFPRDAVLVSASPPRCRARLSSLHLIRDSVLVSASPPRRRARLCVSPEMPCSSVLSISSEMPCSSFVSASHPSFRAGLASHPYLIV